MLVELDTGDGSSATVTGNPIKTTGHQQTYAPAPRLGADTDWVLGEILGRSAEAIEALRADGVI